MRACNRKIASVIAQTVVLLVGAIMLFIDNNRTGVSQWRENGRAGADNNQCPAASGGFPYI